ncbi:MAG: C69 family dipeptidase [Bacteroidales bacterium]
MRHFFFLSILLFIWSLTFSQGTADNGFDCFTVIAGKDATQSDAVVLAHNEDDHGENLVNWFKIPRKKHSEDETITLKNGAEIPQAKTTWGYLWLEMPGQKFADSYMNEHGVTIASNACSSREDNPDLTEGGIGYWLRKIMAERAKTAKEAVMIGGELIEKYGYASSGRTYSIADPDEAWVMSVVNGKQWVAARVPDDEVMVIPNYYTLTEVDLEDESRFMGSPDLIEYAIERNWYNPEEGPFNFREVYSNPRSLASIGNIARKWKGIELISDQEYALDETFPFTLKPGKKLKLTDFMRVLEDHYEGTKFDGSKNYQYGDPHSSGPHSICAATNQYGFVTELRSDMPVEIGAVMWLAPRRPCTQPFIPWHLGMDEIPADFALTDPETALKDHFDPPENILEKAEGHAFVDYVQFAEEVDEEYKELIPKVETFKSGIENELIEQTRELEKQALDIYSKDKEKARQMLMDFTVKYLEQTNQEMDQILLQHEGESVE